ncbi:hypothetical protein BZA05DRAFT_381803, partial [Tricharina praecox]|uniref:uncharacterized protein n=1 Tax=Tricharina praecox TaxID=43433 RepID=UPI00221ED6B6
MPSFFLSFVFPFFLPSFLPLWTDETSGQESSRSGNVKRKPNQTPACATPDALMNAHQSIQSEQRGRRWSGEGEESSAKLQLRDPHRAARSPGEILCTYRICSVS